MAHKMPRKDLAILSIILAFDEFQYFREFQILDPSLVDHLLIALKSRLKVFYAQCFNFDPSKKLARKPKILNIAIVIDYIQETSSCLSPHYRGC